MDTMPIRFIPETYKVSRLSLSLFYLFKDFVLIALLGAGILWMNSWLFGPLLALVLGATLSGLFVIGHDCGHRSFAEAPWLNDLIGHLTTSWVLLPFHVWRLDHDQHHRFTGHVERDTAWRPITYRLWQRMPAQSQKIYLWTRQLFFLGSFYTTYANIKLALTVIFSRKEHRYKKLFLISLIAAAIALVIYIGFSYHLGGWYGVVCLFVIPQMMFHFLLSTFTYFHHTAPDTMFLSKTAWKPGLSQLYLTLHVNYPKLLEFLVHHINWHVPHHICTKVPHYRLKACHRLLKEAYPGMINERTFSVKYAWQVTSRCHFISSKVTGQMHWVTYAQAAEEERNRKSLRQVSLSS